MKPFQAFLASNRMKEKYMYMYKIYIRHDNNIDDNMYKCMYISIFLVSYTLTCPNATYAPATLEHDTHVKQVMYPHALVHTHTRIPTHTGARVHTHTVIRFQLQFF